MGKTLFLLAGVVGLAGCPASNDTVAYGLQYREALAATPGAPWDAGDVARRFVATYADLGAPQMPERVAGLYAEDLYFNDTLATLRTRDALVDYLKGTAGRVDEMKVEMLDAHSSGNDVYLRWLMHLEFKAGWRRATTDTIGVTHLRLDETGRIVLHQDFWDKAEGIYRAVPFIGALIKPRSL